MSSVVLGVTTFVLTTSIMLYFLVIAAQTAVLVVESVSDRSATRRFFYPALVQNIGVATVLVAFTFQSPGLTPVGALLVAAAIIMTEGRPHARYRSIELPLLISAILSFAAVGVTRGFI